MDNHWSIEAIHETAGNNWSLEGDNQLLNLMKSISKNLEQRCMTSNNNLNRLMLDVDKTKIKLGNATTKLLDLNNVKFVEHSVIDMDSSIANMEKCSTGESDKTFVSLPKAVEEAVTNGLNMMDRCYEKVLLNLEDSDDEDDNGQKHVMCQPRDPYLNRPLPYLIGSKLWNEKWHIGLIESEEEVLSDEEPEEFSQSSSEEEDSISNSPQTSNPPTTSESDFVPNVVPREDLFHRLADDVEEKSPLFIPEDNKHRDKIKVLPTTTVRSVQNVAALNSESINKTTKQLTEPSVPLITEQPTKQSIFVQPKKPEQKYLNLFDDEPPMLNEPIRNERKPVNLFLDSDEDDNPITNTKKPSSIFNNNIANRPTFPTSASIPQVDNVPKVDQSNKITFNGDADNNNVRAVQRDVIKPSKPSKSNDFGGLFDDEPPDDFFDIIVKEQSIAKIDNKKIEQSKQQSKTVNLFGSDDDDDDFSKIIGVSKKTETNVSSVSVSAKENIPPVKQIEKVIASQSPYSSPFRNPGPPKSYVSFLDDESPSFNDDKEPGIKEPIAPLVTSGKSLFDCTPPDDIVHSPQTSTRKSPAKIIYDDIAATLQEKSVPTSSLFDENPLDNKIVTAGRPVALPRQSTPKAIHDKTAESSKSTGTVSDDSNKERKPEHTLARDETDQSLSFKKNLSLFSNPEAGKLPTVDNETKPKPNKLKTNFNINVAALLPGAKLPSQKQSASVKQDRIEYESDPEPEKFVKIVGENETISSGNATTKTNSSEDTSGRLACLSKNRAKIQVQRKPSTRTGRQNLYKKTLVAGDETVVPSLETTDSISYEANTNAAPLDNVLKTDSEDDDWLNETVEQVGVPPLDGFNNSNVPLPQDESNTSNPDDEEDWLKTIDEKPSSPSKTDLYEDDWLSTKVVNAEPKPFTQTMSHVMNYDWLTASNLPPDDINYSVDDNREQDDWLTSYASKEKSSVVVDLPNDDDWLITRETKEQSRKADLITRAAVQDRDEDDDWLLQSILQHSEKKKNVKADEDDWLTESLAPKTSTIEAKNRNEKADENDWLTESLAPPKASTSQEKNIDEDADEGDWLTESLAPPKASTTSEAKNRNVKSDEDDWLTESLAPPKASTTSEAKNRNEKSDEDDWLTESLAPPKASTTSEAKNRNEKSVSEKINQNLTDPEDKRSHSILFGSDDEDDDLFKSLISQQKKATTTTKQSATTKAVKTTKSVSIKATAKSLFSDDDNSDTDDLFGTTTKIQKAKIEIGNKNKPKVDKVVKTGLFDDEDDDDDDIYASKTPKQRAVQTDTKKKHSVTKLVATIPASNDPLADLLK